MVRGVETARLCMLPPGLEEADLHNDISYIAAGELEVAGMVSDDAARRLGIGWRSPAAAFGTRPAWTRLPPTYSVESHGLEETVTLMFGREMDGLREVAAGCRDGRRLSRLDGRPPGLILKPHDLSCWKVEAAGIGALVGGRRRLERWKEVGRPLPATKRSEAARDIT